MAKRTRTSDMRNKVEFYRQSEIFDYNSGSYILSWGLEFTSWCRETTIYREQLEASIGGANVLPLDNHILCTILKACNQGL